MSSIRHLLQAALVAAGLAACSSGVQNVETAKTAGYTRQPRSILAMQLNGDPFPDIFKTTLAQRMTACGVALKFAPQVNGAPYNSWPEAEARLTFRQLNKQSATLSKRSTGQVVDKFADMYRYEFELYDATLRKTVWVGHGDFKTHDDLIDVHMVNSAREEAADSWSDELVEMMRKDGLLSGCAAKAGAQPPPAPVLAVETAALPPPSEPPVSATGVTVDGVLYYSLAEAEDAYRRPALLAVSRIKPLGLAPRPSLLIVIPTESRIAAKAKFAPDKTQAQKEVSLAVSASIRSILLEAKADAIRRSGLFEHVTLIREDDVAEADFRSAAYKIWETPSSSWVMSRKAGGKQPVAWPNHGVLGYADLVILLNNLQAALTALDKN